MIREYEIADADGLDRDLLQSILERGHFHELRCGSVSKVPATQRKRIRAEFAHSMHDGHEPPLSMRMFPREHDRQWLERGLHRAPAQKRERVVMNDPDDAVPVTIEDDPTARRELFPDRRSAGKRLAQALVPHASEDTMVIGLARGGIVVADEIARTLELPLDVWLVRKIGVPFRPEIAMGALAEGASLVIDHDIVAWTSTTSLQLRTLVHNAAQQIRERARRYRHGRPRPDVHGKRVFLVDDGIVTGGTLRAAIRSLRKCGAKHVVIAAPVVGPAALQVLKYEADEIVCLARPLHLVSVGAWYADFHQVPDREVAYLLASAALGRR